MLQGKHLIHAVPAVHQSIVVFLWRCEITLYIGAVASISVSDVIMCLFLTLVHIALFYM